MDHRKTRRAAFVERLEDRTLLSVSLLKDINTTPSGSNPAATLSSNPITSPVETIDINGTEYFFVQNGNSGPELWKTDGTGSTRLITMPDVPFYAQTKDVNGILYFLETGMGLWRSDGTPAGTGQVNNVIITNGLSNPGNLTVFDGNLYFLGKQPYSSTIQIWKTNGTSGQTSPIEALPPDVRVSAPGPFFGPDLAAGANTLLLNLRDYLYSMDPAGNLTALGPSASEHINPQNFPENNIAVLGNLTYFEANVYVTNNGQQTTDYRLYRTDGTAAGTEVVAHLPSGVSSVFAAAGGHLYFTCSGQMWGSDGTSQGTVPLVTSSASLPPFLFGNKVFFDGKDSSGNDAVYATDGTPQGTSAIGSIHAWSTASAGGMLYMKATQGSGPFMLWQSDGTMAGTAPVNDPILQTLQLGDIIGSSNGRLYFSANDGVHGMEPWKLESPGIISGYAFDDLNHDGLREPGEGGLAGVTVYLDLNHNGQLDPNENNAVTDSRGNYLFTNVPAGSYTVREVVPAGYALTAPLTYAGDASSSNVPTTGPTFGNVLLSSVTMDLSYFLTIARNFGSAGTFANGDLNGDGTVNLADFLLLARNFGHPLPGSGTPSVVPSATSRAAGRTRRM